jgi:hypothetical protein
MSNKTKKENLMKNKKQKRIQLGSISYGDSTPAQKNKFSTLEKIGFKKIPSDDGFVMYELTPSKLNQPKEKA